MAGTQDVLGVLVRLKDQQRDLGDKVFCFCFFLH